MLNSKRTIYTIPLPKTQGLLWKRGESTEEPEMVYDYKETPGHSREAGRAFATA